VHLDQEWPLLACTRGHRSGVREGVDLDAAVEARIEGDHAAPMRTVEDQVTARKQHLAWRGADRH
jgi:hypothetical protein